MNESVFFLKIYKKKSITDHSLSLVLFGNWELGVINNIISYYDDGMTKLMVIISKQHKFQLYFFLDLSTKCIALHMTPAPMPRWDDEEKGKLFYDDLAY